MAHACAGVVTNAFDQNIHTGSSGLLLASIAAVLNETRGVPPLPTRLCVALCGVANCEGSVMPRCLLSLPMSPRTDNSERARRWPACLLAGMPGSGDRRPASSEKMLAAAVCSGLWIDGLSPLPVVPIEKLRERW